MPFYNYECGSCGQFEALAKLDAFADPAVCPECGKEAPRLMSAPPIRIADEVRQAGSPRSKAGGHPSGCACCGPAPASVRSTATPKLTSFLAEG